MAHACPVGRSIAAAPATGSVLAFEQQLDYLRRNFPRALIELRFGEIGNRVRHGEEFKILQSPRACHRLAGSHEHIRDDRCRRHTLLFKHYAVEHTARAA